MYYVFSALIILICIAAVFSFIYVQKKKTAAVLAVVSVVLPVIGILLCLISFMSFESALANGGFTEEFISWAGDTYFSYLKGVFIVSSGTMLLATASALIRPKHKYLRAVLITLSCMLILVLSPVFSFISSVEEINISSHVLISAAAVSLITLFPLFFDYRRMAQADRLNDKGKKHK